MFSDQGRFELIRRGLAVRVSWSGPTFVSASAKGQRGLFSCNVTFYKRFRLWLRGSATLIVYCSERSGYDLSLISDLTVQLKEKCTEATSPGHLGQRKQCFQGFGYVRKLRSLFYFFGPIRNIILTKIPSSPTLKCGWSVASSQSSAWRIFSKTLPTKGKNWTNYWSVFFFCQ